MPFLPFFFILGALYFFSKNKAKNAMQISAQGIKFLVKHEGKRYKAYQDTKGLWTIGVGHLILKSEPHLLTETLNDQQVIDLLNKDIQTSQNAINRENLQLTQNQFDSLVSFVFNVGAGAFKRSTLLRLLKEGKPDEAAKQFARWENKKRREDEKNLFLKA
jgi:lysozyme